LRPLRLELVVAHLVEAACAAEEETEGMLGDGVVVQTDAGGDDDLGSIEAGAQDVVGAGGERLDPFQVLEALGGIFEVVGCVGPGYEDVGVYVLFGNGRLDIIRVH
jgi:hypothetical protein